MHISNLVSVSRVAASVAASLPAEAAEAAFEHFPGRIVRHARGRTIFEEGSPATHVYKVVSGTVRTCKLLADGRRQIGEFVLAGEVFGLDGLGDHFYTAEAVTDCTVVCYTRRAVEENLLGSRNAAAVVHRLMLNSLGAAQRSLLALGRKTAVERLASFLLELQDRTGTDAGCVTLPMPRHDIADHLGLTIETVSRAFGTLKKARAIELDGAHRVRVRNRLALERISEGVAGFA